jgi:Flp pilus assembly protein TadD
LGYALREAGRVAEAQAAWQDALRLSPGDPIATAELATLQPQAAARQSKPTV